MEEPKKKVCSRLKFKTFYKSQSFMLAKVKVQNTVPQVRNSIICTKDCSGQRAGDLQVLSWIPIYFPLADRAQGTPGFGWWA